MNPIKKFDDAYQDAHQTAFDWIEYRWGLTSGEVSAATGIVANLILGTADALRAEPPYLSMVFVLMFVYFFFTWGKRIRRDRTSHLVATAWLRSLPLTWFFKGVGWVGTLSMLFIDQQYNLVTVLGLFVSTSSVYFLLCFDDVDDKKRRHWEELEAERYAERAYAQR